MTNENVTVPSSFKYRFHLVGGSKAESNLTVKQLLELRKLMVSGDTVLVSVGDNGGFVVSNHITFVESI